MNADLEKFRTDLQVLKETAQQAEKDFYTCGLELALTEEVLPYDALLSRVVDQVEESIRRSGALQNLLYRVDIPESKFVQLKDTSENFVLDLSRLILEREFMKVVTRRLYKNQIED